MFSGIVEELGQVKNISRRSGNITVIEIGADKVLEDTLVGDSIAVNGACLTVTANKVGILSFEAMPETLKVTNLGRLKVLEKVNLERSLKVGDRISGHFVNGHIDCLGVIRNKKYMAGNLGLEIAVPLKFLPYAISKGSVALDGISLTIAEKSPATFSVYIIPHTLRNTTLSFKGPSDKLNVEFDILAKQAASPKI
ncbi:MAG: riboflavin synthase [Candidatus Omnitrophica bacterium]|nr:riboflavin synthase [Candidatus Omnitrophota bacterium]